MHFIYELIYKYIKAEQINIGLIFVFEILKNIIQTMGFSTLISLIVTSAQNKQETKTNYYNLLFVYLSIILIVVVFFYKHTYSKIISNIKPWFIYQLMKQTLTVNNDNFSEIKFTSLFSPITKISSFIAYMITHIIKEILPNILFLLITTIYLFYYNIWLGVSFLIGNILIILCSLYFMNKRIVAKNKVVLEINQKNDSYILDVLNNFEKIIFKGQSSNEANILLEKTNKLIYLTNDYFWNFTGLDTILISTVNIFLFGLMSNISLLYYSQKLTITEFITILSILIIYKDNAIRLINDLPDFVEFNGRIQLIKTQFNNMKNMSTNLITDSTSTELIVSGIAFKKIVFENVTFKYDSATEPVFSNYSQTLHTDNHDIFGINSISGSGKTTFIKLLLKLHKPSTGNIYIDDTNINLIDPNYIRSNITYVNQDAELFDMKIIDNIFYGCLLKDKCQHYLDIIMKYPNVNALFNGDINTITNNNLSGGQKHVVNIIAGLINPSIILILDEPTNGMDKKLKMEIIEIIKLFKKIKDCIIIISHDSDTFPLFNKRIVLN